jgi:hypothetical protein
VCADALETLRAERDLRQVLDSELRQTRQIMQGIAKPVRDPCWLLRCLWGC